MDRLITPFQEGLTTENGYALAAAFAPDSPSSDPKRNSTIVRSLNPLTIQTELRSALKTLLPSAPERDAWVDVFIAYHKSLLAILAAQHATTNEHGANSTPTTTAPRPGWDKAYTSWKELVNGLHRGYSQSHFDAWTLPLLYQTTKHLRTLALRADATQNSTSTPPPSAGTAAAAATATDDDPSDPSLSWPHLEDCARQTNRIFALVTQDRSPPPNRKYGTYFVAVLLFKTYFRLGSIGLCKNIIRSIGATAGGGVADMPPLERFPRSHQVGYRYYVGVVAFLEERYEEAERELEAAWGMCLAGEAGRRQAERILIYLVPTKLLTKHVLPGKRLLAGYDGLEGLFAPLCRAVRKGNLSAFDRALADGEDEFVRMRVYLTLERGRDVCARNLLRKVYLNAGWEDGKEGEVRRSRIKIEEWAAGLRVVGERMDMDEVEGLIASMIYKNLIKGYISRAHATVVLNKKGAFPGTGV